MTDPSRIPLTRFPAYMRLWFGRLFGTAANQILMVAVGWQMYDLTGSAWNLGLVGLLQFLPALLLVLVAGHALDRFHRARVLAFACSRRPSSAARSPSARPRAGCTATRCS